MTALVQCVLGAIILVVSLSVLAAERVWTWIVEHINNYQLEER